jgi:phosphoglycerate dehydrogenase-like enzyme
VTGSPLVAVASRSFSRHEVLRGELLARHPGARFNETGRSLAGAELSQFLDGCERAIIALERIDAALLDAVPSLKTISKYGVGLDSLDLAAMERRGVALGWTPGVNRRSVAEMVIAFAIALLHRVPEAAGELRSGVWRQLAGRELTGKTTGIVGCGHVGKEVAVLFRAFGCRVLAHDIVDYREFYERHDVAPAPLDRLLAESDVVTLHVPRDASTENMLSAERLGGMKPGAVLINTARGGLVDEAALARLLAAGQIAGAGFDVFATEPPGELELLKAPTFMATPHIGGSSEEAILAMGRAAIAGLSSARLPSAIVPQLLEKVG